MRTKKIMTAIVTTALCAGVAGLSTQAAAKSTTATEKCYGITKKMKNECGTPKHACAGLAKTNNDPNDWIYVMKGNCDMIMHGSLTPPKQATTTPAKK
jgi:uncharacterized membrane protein